MSKDLLQASTVSIYINLQLMEYNSAGGNKARGLMTVCAYQILADAETITEETMRLARILGWCVELVTIPSRSSRSRYLW